MLLFIGCIGGHIPPPLDELLAGPLLLLAAPPMPLLAWLPLLAVLAAAPPMPLVEVDAKRPPPPVVPPEPPQPTTERNPSDPSRSPANTTFFISMIPPGHDFRRAARRRQALKLSRHARMARARP